MTLFPFHLHLKVVSFFPDILSLLGSVEIAKLFIPISAPDETDLKVDISVVLHALTQTSNVLYKKHTGFHLGIRNFKEHFSRW